MTERERRNGIVDAVIGRFASKELKPLACTFVKFFLKGEGTKMLGTVISSNELTYDEKIAIVAILRASVFDFSRVNHWNTAPASTDDITQFWDEAVDIVDGKSTLYLDIVETRYQKNDIYGDVRYIHRILNCTTDNIYERELSYKYWWIPTNDNDQQY